MKQTVMEWAQWIGSSRLTNWIAVHEWVVPLSQSLHIMGVAVVFTCALLISFRLLGIGRSSRSVVQLVETLVPWMYRGLALLVLTGAIQVTAEPAREFVGDIFWYKMLMIALVVPLTIWFARSVRRRAEIWDSRASPPVSAKLFGAVSLILWVGIIFCGRFIAYTFNFYVQAAA